jgi:hypothetical protein
LLCPLDFLQSGINIRNGGLMRLPAPEKPLLLPFKTGVYGRRQSHQALMGQS